jgi:hypothetical protein
VHLLCGCYYWLVAVACGVTVQSFYAGAGTREIKKKITTLLMTARKILLLT